MDGESGSEKVEDELENVTSPGELFFFIKLMK